LAALAARCPVVVSRRVAFPLRRGPLSRWKYGRAAHYIAVSEYVKSILAGCGVPAARSSVVYDGVPLLERAAQGDAIVAPATLDTMKGADLVSQAAKLAGVTVRFATDLEAGLGGAALFVYIS
ncbi:MAG: glycosyltransferase, partial [Acidobacteria bacterium]|nr:glycosyltransferase [Acidobacteriota bacterium]